MDFDFDELDELLPLDGSGGAGNGAGAGGGGAAAEEVASIAQLKGTSNGAPANGHMANGAAETPKSADINLKDATTASTPAPVVVPSAEDRGAFDFDDLDDAAEVARRQWAPVPEDVWNKLPGLVPKSRPNSMGELKKVVNVVDKGEYWGLEFPWTPTMLKEWGPAWLTKAMHTAGTLSRDNEITRFVSMDVKAEDTTKMDAENAKWGGAGLKILMKVAYKKPGELPDMMFVKMPHELKGGNERFKNSVGGFGMDWSEVTWYNFFGGRFGDLPLRTPKMYFCDMSRKTTNFIHVIEFIPYGKKDAHQVGPGEYFPPPSKYQDWNLPGTGVEYYYAHVKTMAQFFAWHKQVMTVTDQVERLFMDEMSRMTWNGLFGFVNSWGGYNSAERDKKWTESLADPGVQMMMGAMGFPPHVASGFLEFGKNLIENIARHVFPKELVTDSFLKKFFTEAGEMGNYVAEMTYYSRCIPEYFSLVHPNCQVDNAWYWRDEEGKVGCGLLDWGGVSHSNIPICLANGWIGAEPEMMDEHEEKLLQAFIDEYAKLTGFTFNHRDLWLHCKLAHACVLYGCFANVGTLLQKTVDKKEWPRIKSRRDPQINDNFLARCYFVQVEMLLAMWRKRSPYTAFQEWLKRTKLPRKK